jgi:uncharacterized protein
MNFSQSLHNELSSKGVHIQAVLPGGIRTEFWDLAGLPVTNLPQEMVMSADDLVDAALAGPDAGELITLPTRGLGERPNPYLVFVFDSPDINIEVQNC